MPVLSISYFYLSVTVLAVVTCFILFRIIGTVCTVLSRTVLACTVLIIILRVILVIVLCLVLGIVLIVVLFHVLSHDNSS